MNFMFIKNSWSYALCGKSSTVKYIPLAAVALIDYIKVGYMNLPNKYRLIIEDHQS